MLDATFRPVINVDVPVPEDHSNIAVWISAGSVSSVLGYPFWAAILLQFPSENDVAASCALAKIFQLSFVVAWMLVLCNTSDLKLPKAFTCSKQRPMATRYGAGALAHSFHRVYDETKKGGYDRVE
jgi:hypothetical protein